MFGFPPAEVSDEIAQGSVIPDHLLVLNNI